MSNLEQIRLLAKEVYLAPDGLMRLDPDDRAPPHRKHGLPTVRNENGIFFAVIYYYMSALNGLSDEEDAHRFISAVKQLEVEPGLYNRHSGNVVRDEAHDNLDAICAGSVLFGTSHAAQIVRYGSKNGWSYTNLKPDSWSLRHLLQGGNISYRNICAGNVPYLLNFVWMCGGLWINALARKSGSYESDTQLAWMRVGAITLRFGQMEVPTWMRGLFAVTSIFWMWCTSRKNGWLEGWVVKYYRITHPTRSLARALEDN